MSIRKFIIWCIVVFAVGPRVVAQDDRSTVTLFGGLVNPVSTYGDRLGNNPQITRRAGFDYGPTVGLADRGWGAGIEIRTGVLIRDLSWVLSGKVMFNPSNVEELTATFRHELGDSVDLQFQFGQWVNIPVFTGFTYKMPLGESVNLYGIAAAGVNFTRQASRKGTVGSRTVEEVTFNFAPDFGFEAGLGMEVFGQYDITCRYVDLGRPRYEGVRKLSETFFPQIARRETYIEGDERRVSMIILSIGYRIL